MLHIEKAAFLVIIFKKEEFAGITLKVVVCRAVFLCQLLT